MCVWSVVDKERKREEEKEEEKEWTTPTFGRMCAVQR